MREIKFRAWDKLDKVMYDWERVQTEFTMGYFDDEGLVFQQYTGLKDKNGVDIYERDIIEDSDEERHVVTFKNGGFGRDGKFLINYNTGEYIVTHEPLINSVIDICEVIGNIYEKPELLQEDNNELD